ncbi:MAG: hypothetical protein QW478_00670 [Candidatus Micrarchaeaceae archaeon]
MENNTSSDNFNLALGKLTSIFLANFFVPHASDLYNYIVLKMEEYAKTASALGSIVEIFIASLNALNQGADYEIVKSFIEGVFKKIKNNEYNYYACARCGGLVKV